MADDPSPDDRPAGPLAPGDGLRLLLTTITPGKARKLAAALVDEGLAACVNLVPGLRSIYRWKGTLHDEPETLLLIKTPAEQVDALTRRLAELHPYQVPELLAFAPESGLRTYLDWVAQAVGEARNG